jgi:hypothetical protein
MRKLDWYYVGTAGTLSRSAEKFQTFRDSIMNRAMNNRNLRNSDLEAGIEEHPEAYPKEDPEDHSEKDNRKDSKTVSSVSTDDERTRGQIERITYY